ncbi:carbon-nitrogen hydrolase family protein [Micromonospora sp. NPDC047740]|uniref:carbon-nitrogen hydrolase family protein n=1 Tax=Micromonospora sp. NPDC047740 TaxID=3364254 RepID=UPI003710FA33
MLRLAIGQAPSLPGDVPANTTRAIELLHQAARNGARLLLLSELFLCGYDLAGLAEAPDQYAVGPDSAAVAALTDACRTTGTGLIAGAAWRRPDSRLANAALVVDPAGRLRGTYQKVHLWGAERELFVAGDELLSIQIDGVSLGLGICYDAGFPEFSRAYATGTNADVLLFSSAFARGGEERRYDLYHPMRALENTAYVLTANALGGSFFGRGFAHDPYGRLVTSAGSQPGIALVDIDEHLIHAARATLPYLRDRRPPLPDARLEIFSNDPRLPRP